MENKEEKVVTKTSGGVKALLVILILALIGTSGFIVYDKFIAKDNESKSNTKEETKKEEKKESVKKIDETKEYVYDLKSGEYYKIPTINIDSEDAKKMNEEINDFSNYEKRDEVYNPYYKFKYHYFTNNDVISVLLVKSGDGEGSIFYKVFNINKLSGKKLSNEEIIKIKGLTLDEVKTKMLEIYEKINSSSLEKAKNKEYDELNNEIILNVYETNKKNFEELDLENVEFFLNDKKELCVSFKEYQVAGPKMMYVIYNLDTKEIPNYRS